MALTKSPIKDGLAKVKSMLNPSKKTVTKRDSQPLTAAERAKRYREKHSILRIGVSSQELEKLNEITEFYSWPNQNLDNSQTIQLMIHRFHHEVETKRKELGTCKHCGEDLPAGCARLKEGGLFKGDSNCFHTTNRLTITNLSLEATNEHN